MTFARIARMKEVWIGFIGRIIHGSNARVCFEELKARNGEAVDFGAVAAADYDR